MRFSTILAASTMALLSVISAQSTVPDAAAMAACSKCVNNAGIAASPACKGLENTTNSPNSTPTDKQKACWCGLKANMNFADGCVGPDKCTAVMKEQVVTAISLVTSQPGACDGVSATSAAGARFCGASSAKVAAAGAAALAVAGALL
ncbi:hypothetical protein BGZ96_005204 [Linnemannia gamsii]|uniref:Uncharacterized protein n=1 Tax=Linnemannia gamsii TaxID=64522 RepID=A0ABQ7K572_9FUNG|nr:hypothetical protein BGZ96_005204 [Linnemannia gamsii]